MWLRKATNERVMTACVATVIAVSALALLVLTGRRAADTRPAAKSGSSPFGGVRPPSSRPPGLIDAARNTGTGAFADGVKQLSEWNAAGTRAVPLVPQSACCLAWSDRRKVFSVRFGTGRSARLAMVSVDGRYGVWLQPTAAAGLQLSPGAWSPKGDQLALSGVDPHRPARDGVYILRIPGELSQYTRSHGRIETEAIVGRPRRIARMSARRPDLPLAYSPDGRSLLVFRRNPAGGRLGRLYVITPAGAMVSVGTQSVMCCYFGAPASWSPDGRHIAYAGFVSPHGADPAASAVFVADAKGAHPRQITQVGGWTTSARWSPNGDWIVFDRINRGRDHDEFLVKPDGGETRLIPTEGADGGGSCCAQWSPGGRYLAYEHTTGSSQNTVELDVVNTTGPAHPTPVTSPAHGYLMFSWLR